MLVRAKSRVTQDLINAVQQGNYAAAKKALKQGADPNGYYVPDAATPLYHAALNNHLAIAKLLLKHDADPLRCYRGDSSYSAAIANGCNDIAALLPDAYAQDWLGDRVSALGFQLRIEGICFAIAYLSLVMDDKVYARFFKEISRIPLDDFAKQIKLARITRKKFVKRAKDKAQKLNLTLEAQFDYIKAKIEASYSTLSKKDKSILLADEIFSAIKLLSEPWLYASDIYTKENFFNLKSWIGSRQEKYVHHSLNLLMPSNMEKDGGLECIDHFSGIYTADELSHQLERLHDIVRHASNDYPHLHSLKIIMKGNRHTLSLKVMPNKFIFTESNQFPVVQHWVNSADVAKKIITGYFSENQVASFSTLIYTAKSDASIYKKCLTAWKLDADWQKIHSVTMDRLQLRDSHNQSWYANAEFSGQLDVVRQLQQHDKDSKFLKNMVRVCQKITFLS